MSKKQLILDYIMSVTEFSEQLNEYVPNSHIQERFKEVLTGLELEEKYPNEFKRAGVVFYKHIEEIFKPINTLDKKEKKDAILRAYQALREKENPIRNNLKLMYVRLQKIIMEDRNEKANFQRAD